MNYILFLPDELRADALGCYGNAAGQTPAFDRMAGEGVRFGQCHVQNPVCSPSRCSMFTGRYVHNNGHRSLWSLLQPGEENLLGYLKEAGYEVRAYGKNDLFSREALPLCTDLFEESRHDGLPLPTNTRQLGEDGFYDFLYEPLPGRPEQHMDYIGLQKALAFLRGWKEGDRPFFLFLPLELPHCPYTLPEPYYNKVSAEALPPLLPHGRGKPEFHRLIRAYRALADAGALRKLRAVYLGMASYTDWLLGMLLDCLAETGREEDTLLVAASDHGDYAGDYGLVEKWPSGMEDVLTHVPLLVRGPGCAAGHTVHGQVELFDILPTVLESAGIKARHQHFAQSLWPALRGGAGDPERCVYCEGGYEPHETQCNEGYDEGLELMKQYPAFPYLPKVLQQRERPGSVCRAVMLRSPAYKLVVRTNGENELYHLAQDPGELENLYGSPLHSGVQAQLEKQLLQWYIKTSDVVPLKKDGRGV